MAVDIRWLGHAAFELKAGGATVLVDPFLSGNPKAAVSADEVEPTHILLTHGHPDHYGDTVDIAKRTGAPVVAITEVAQEISEQGVEAFDPNLAAPSSSTGGRSRWCPPGTRRRRPTARPARRPAC
jgi:L-ascorbate metabolism protein UlaG (beta-lactamase superfamily)